MSVIKNYNTNKSPYYKIFSSGSKVEVVKSPVKVKILEALTYSNLSFNKIVEITGKAKPTVSQHLQELVGAGLLKSFKDPLDARRKIFCINADFLGEVSSEKKTQFNIDNYFAKLHQLNDPFEFYRLILRSIRAEFWNEGINIDPILYNAGKRVGDVFYVQLKDSDLDILLVNITEFWKDKQLGRVEILKLEPLTICVYDCFECKDLPVIGKPVCSFDSGILDAIFTKHFSRNVTTNEITCYAQGDDYCTFIIA